MKEQILLFVIILITTSVTLAQHTKVKLPPPGRKTFITYENDRASILFEEASFTEAFNAIPKTAKEQAVFDDILKEFKKTNSTIQVKANGMNSASERQVFLESIINSRGLGVQLLNAGKASVFNKKSAKTATVIEYGSGSNGINKFYFPGDDTAFVKFETDAMPAEESAVPVADDMPVVEAAVPVEAADEDLSMSLEITADNADEAVFTATVEQSPEYPGGDEALKKYFEKNMKKNTGCEGASYVYFFVNNDGTLTDIRIIKSLSPKCDEEALRLIKNMKPWTPGRQNGKAVKVAYVQPVIFKAQ